MKRLVQIVFLLVLVFSLLAAPFTTQTSKAAPGAAGDFIPGQVILKVLPGTDINLLSVLYNLTVLDTLLGHSDVFLLQAPLPVDLSALLALLRLDPRVVYAEPNYITDNPEEGSTDRTYGWNGTDPKPYTKQPTAKSLALKPVYRTSQGAGITVAVLDSGAQLAHPILSGSLSPDGYDFIDRDANPEEVKNNQDEDQDGRVDEGYGHGTHVAGIVHLIAPQSRLLIVRVLDSDGRGSVFETANAILYAVSKGAKVANLSLGTPQSSQVLQEAVNEAAQKGMLVVAAAGNWNTDHPQFPAADACAIGVTSLYGNKVKSSFGNYGAWVDLAAPGEDILSSFPVDGYAWWSGTSMASPIAAGQAALLRSLNPNLTPQLTAQYMASSARSVQKWNKDYSGLLGAGRVDIRNSLNLLRWGKSPSGPAPLGNCAP